MADLTPQSPSTVTVNPAPTPAPIKSGWQTTEAWAAMIALGMAGWALQQLGSLLPLIAANPSLPGWAAPLVAVAPMAIVWLGHQIAAKYGDIRTELKLGSSSNVAAAITAGAAAASADPAATLAAGNT